MNSNISKFQPKGIQYMHLSNNISQDVWFSFDLDMNSMLIMRPGVYHELFLCDPCVYERIVIEFDESTLQAFDPQKQ